MKHYEGVKTLEVLEGADNYNSWIASKISPHVKSPVLEVGAGTGNISSFFKNVSELVVTDIDQNLVDHLRVKFKDSKNVKVEVFDIANNLDVIKNKFNTIFSVNVLEHIKNDEIALVNMHKLLNNNGTVVLLVPAKKIAYKKLDRALGHYRRYEKEELRSKLKNTGFEIKKIEYFNIVGLLSWLVRDIVENDHSKLKPSQVKMFDLIVPLLKLIEPRHGLPIGISLIAVGTKK